MIRRLPDDALASLQPLFESVFKHSISVALLQWKYAALRGESWVTTNAAGDAEIHCGVGFRTVLLCGEAVQAAQLMDLMAAPKARGLTRQDSPFTTLMQQILRSLPRPGNDAGVAFGFPSDRAMRLGEHLGVYREVDRMMALEFSPVPTSVAGLHWRELVQIDTPVEAMLDKLWAEMARDFSTFSIGVRNAQYLKHRYLAHPEKRYTLLMVEKKGFWRDVPIGLAVVGPGHERRELLDVVCASKHLQDVVQTAQHWLAGGHTEVLHFFLTERFAKQMAVFAKRCETTQFRIMGNPFSPAASTARLENRWWLTGGDTDYR